MQIYAIEAMVGRRLGLKQRSGNGMENLSGKLQLPEDICEWVSPETLLSWVREEIDKPNGTPGNGFPKPVLAVLAFAYCRGIYDSEEILRVCDSVPEFQTLSSGSVSNVEQLRTARHKKLVLLINVTVRLLTRAVCEHCKLAPEELSPELKRRVHENSVQRIDNAILIDRMV